MRRYQSLIAALGALALTLGAAHAQDEPESEEAREELSRLAEEAVMQLREENEIANILWEESYGYAVFDTTKGGLIVTGVGGTGVAQQREGDGEDVYMHVGGAGIGLGAGLENYNLVLLIQNQETYEEFIDGQWDGAISGQAAAGEAGVTAEEQFVNGIAAFRMTEGGLMAQADATALRFWPSSRLNVAAID